MQYVSWEGKDSGRLPVLNGALQGSVIGPILFIVYINNLPLATDAKCVLFADNTTVLSRGDPQSFDSNLEQVNSWFSANLLKLNSTKTRCALPQINWQVILIP